MRSKVVIRFNDQERQVVEKFCADIQMGLEEFCKRAVAYSIRDSYKRAEAMQLVQQQLPPQEGEQSNVGNNSVSTIDSGSAGLLPGDSHTDADTGSLPNTEAAPNSSPQ